MAYWLCITNRDNWGVVKEKNVWGVAKRHKNTIAKVKPGDKLVFYVKQERKNKEVLEPKIVGIFEVVSELYTDSTKIFKSPPHLSETYPLRIKIRPIKLGELDFKPLIPKLKFITNKKKWSGHLMGKAMREILEEDYRLIEGLL
ncbi:EVE domain-containing protein [Thermococcus sp. M36]|uniref:EVE domain-containing protein n=1 Tax=Thermococcus sp. M36 TaxID=1638261 RepID=UPI00143A95DD|nr:EVE domain-containing protein [Thermococcus sp. M36]NJE05128.1 EVE domain-containing protein [Thermococcus sp. M36]